MNWTEQELKTLRQNMHFNATGISKVIPARSKEAIRKRRQKLMLPKNFLAGAPKNEGMRIAATLSRRGWNAREITLYIRACSGEQEGVQFLSKLGLWNMECKGVMS